MATLQTLDRGLAALTLIARYPRGLTVQALADELGVHRAVAYRIVATLEVHGFVARLEDGRLRLGGAVLGLAGRYAPQFREANRDVLAALAEHCDAAAYIAAAEGDHCVAVAVAEPERGTIRVGYRVGARHPLDRGAAGLAILAAMPPRPREPDRVRQVRSQGYAVTHGELEPGAVGLAAGFRMLSPDDGTWRYQSIGVVAVGELDLDRAREAVLRAAAGFDEAGLREG